MQKSTCVCVNDNAHCISTHYYIYTYYTVCFCFFVCLLLYFQLSIFLFAPIVTFINAETNLPYSSVHPIFHRHNIPTSYQHPSSNRTNVKSGVSALSSTSTAFGTAASNTRLDHTGNGHIDEALRQQALAEEEAAMNQYKVLFYKIL